MTTANALSPTALWTLDTAIYAAETLTLQGQLDRRVYLEVDRAIQAAGGRWDRKRRVHVFDGDARSAMSPTIEAERRLASRQQQLGQFYTPPWLADRVIEAAALRPGLDVLEPSAGRGALAALALEAGCSVDCVEMDPRNAQILASIPFRQVAQADFLQQQPRRQYDRVVMNPPFAGTAAMQHVLHARKFLRQGGVLVAVMPASVATRRDRLSVAVRMRAEAFGGSIARLPPGLFRSEGTSASVVLVAIREEPDYAAEMRLPEGETCGTCHNCKRCCAMFGHTPADTSCDFWPSRFQKAQAPVAVE